MVVHRSIVRFPITLYPMFPRSDQVAIPYEDQILISPFIDRLICFTKYSMIHDLLKILEKANMTLAWKRLIRFEAIDGRILRGEPLLPEDKDIDLGFITETDQLRARILEGDDIYDTTGKTVLTKNTAQVKRVLSPLAQSDVPILRCVGLNYAKHSE